ncbi:S66 family peptidase [Lactococcus petauri]|uniref:S66 family peptidase n=1 Tax=Lactococcus petauri TaxID=1940789 RepID=UPI00254A82CF|nr:S66 peptidase family protein [Lactococcus petauri]
MDKIFASKLKYGDEIRVISPSSSIKRVGGFKDNLISKKRLENLGFKVTFGDHILENDNLYSSSISSRVSDIHDAFSDKNVKAILTTIGGLNCNELLSYIDWDLIKRNPKMFIGYSDTTSLHNAIRAKTGLITYYGPAYSSFKMNELQEFQTQSWIKAMKNKNYILEPSDLWTSDLWFDKSVPRNPKKTVWKIYNHGEAKGVITGGNIQTYNLQAGTKFLPQVESPILFLELAEGGVPLDFSRYLAQILEIHTDISGLVIGRFPTDTEISEETLHYLLDKFPILKTVPVVYDVDFGHTQPILTIPLGGEVKISTDPIVIQILQG